MTKTSVVPDPARRLAAVLAFSLLLPVAKASADMSDWAENEGGRMRIIALAPEADGTVRGALQIEPKAGWMTYWKEPGQAGIPPQVTFAPASGVRLTEMRFPVPKVFDEDGVRDIGYDHAVTLPFTLKAEPGKVPLQLTAAAFVGLCRNICIPFQAEFRLPISTPDPSSEEEARLLQAASQTLPEAPSTDFTVADHALSDDRKLLKLSLKLPAGQTGAQIYVVGPQGHVLVERQKAEQKGDLLTVEMPVPKLPARYEPKGKRWDILVVAGSRAMESSLAFE
ncbi:protein-disulfide reductase DsbD domain-containing protein [Rhizobium oryzicola]|uniref:Protein-disulfide reductase DsbD family protein n=1 Tax=Rhizobium oryzicola TaxID=1232668 RepID=A0ABT8SSG5_9HYPH|nr:protein-disulfide reductase DsbD domain-containing protein [Rhizobium oryzicola]MDO1581324.1 protein-disulfide reductase DsbD family protein [Rhizobium oryzicola]